MGNKAIFLDRDGVLNEDSGYVHKIEDFNILPGVIDGLKRLRDFRFFIVTNQSGIGRGYYTVDDFHKFNNHLLDELKRHEIKIEKTYFCPHHPDVMCECRKPNAKSVMEAAKNFDIDLSNSWVVGDHVSDIQLGKNAGCKTIYLLTGHGQKHLKEALLVKPDYIAATFEEVADYILSDKK
jgi:D-glycero-D-manno-heptose 1,7-bisphosphate phosphatase